MAGDMFMRRGSSAAVQEPVSPCPKLCTTSPQKNSQTFSLLLLHAALTLAGSIPDSFMAP